MAVGISSGGTQTYLPPWLAWSSMNRDNAAADETNPGHRANGFSNGAAPFFPGSGYVPHSGGYNYPSGFNPNTYNPYTHNPNNYYPHSNPFDSNPYFRKRDSSDNHYPYYYDPNKFNPYKHDTQNPDWGNPHPYNPHDNDPHKHHSHDNPHSHDKRDFNIKPNDPNITDDFLNCKPSLYKPTYFIVASKWEKWID